MSLATQHELVVTSFLTSWDGPSCDFDTMADVLIKAQPKLRRDQLRSAVDSLVARGVVQSIGGAHYQHIRVTPVD